MSILNQISVILLASVFFGAILKYLKQPIFLAYIIVGLFIGGYFLPGFKLDSSNSYFEVLISILLFVSGLSVNLKHLKDLGENTIVKNVFTFLVISILFYFLLNFLGFDFLESIILSLCLSFSSSVVVNKVVSDDYLHRDLFSKISASHLLIQTIFLLLVLVFLNTFSIGRSDENFTNILINNFLKTIILVVNLYLVSRYVISRIEKFISNSQEFLFLFVIAFGFGVVSLFKFLNLSYELGALVAGVLLSIHAFSQDVIFRFKVIRDLAFLGFFVFLGAGLDFNILQDKFLLIFVLSIILVVIKLFGYLIIEKLFATPIRESFFSSLSLISLSEFSLVIILLANANYLLNAEVFSVFGFLYIFLTIFNIYVINHREFLYKKNFEFLQLFKSVKEVREKIKETDVILFGSGKLGFDFIQNYKYLKTKFLAIDYDYEVINKLKKQKLNYLYGDLNDREFFEAIPYLNSRLIYLTIDNVSLTKEILNKLKNKKYQGVKIVVSYNYEDTLEFYRLGADYVVMPDYISGKFVSDLTLNLGFEPKKYLSEKSIHIDSLKLKENHNF